MKIKIAAPAKINLFLNVLGKRDDGYHNIQSVLAPVSLCDDVMIEYADCKKVETVIKGGSAKLDGIPWPASMPSSADNLATRAAVALKVATGYAGGARVTIHKHIPVAGGLGGGSSDAAAALKGLNDAWRTGLSRDALMGIAAGLGCDIPAMVHGGIVLAEGRGELVSSLDDLRRGSLCMLLVNPGLEVSTADIYSRHTVDLTFSHSEDKFENILAGLRSGCPEMIARGLFNSLQKTVFRKYPLLRVMKNELEAAGAVGVLLSGSGATLLALVRDREHGLNLEKFVRNGMRRPVWTSVVESGRG